MVFDIIFDIECFSEMQYDMNRYVFQGFVCLYMVWFERKYICGYIFVYVYGGKKVWES